MPEIQVSLVADRPASRKGLEALIAGTPGLAVSSVHAAGDSAIAALEATACDVLVVQLADGHRQAELTRKLASRFPTLRVLALAADPGEESMLELIRAGARGCLPAEHTAPSRLLEAIVELHRGGAPLTPRLAAALVRSLQKVGTAPLEGPRVSRRETELLQLFAAGHSYKSAAAELGLSIDTVRFHLRNLYAKLQVHSKVEAVLKAARDGLI